MLSWPVRDVSKQLLRTSSQRRSCSVIAKKLKKTGHVFNSSARTKLSWLPPTHTPHPPPPLQKLPDAWATAQRTHALNSNRFFSTKNIWLAKRCHASSYHPYHSKVSFTFSKVNFRGQTEHVGTFAVHSSAIYIWFIWFFCIFILRVMWRKQYALAYHKTEVHHLTCIEPKVSSKRLTL